jgi:hypothetical protein
MKTPVRAYWFGIYLFISVPFVLLGQPNFTLNGSASLISEGCYRLTSSQNGNEVGAIWGDFGIDLRNSLEVRFSVNLGCNKVAGEGVAFVMHTQKERNATLGCGGSGMGFGRVAGCKGIMPSLAVELDTRHTAGSKDLFRPHLALVQNGDLARPLSNPVALQERGDILDCEYHEVRILWTPSKQEFLVYIDENLRLTYKGDLCNRVFKGETDICFGFVGSSSAQAASQMVCVQMVAVEVDEQMERRLSFEEGVGIFPNPQREKLTIQLDFQTDEHVEMQLYDSSGKLIYEIPPHVVRENQYHLNLPGVPSGVYYVTVTNGVDRVSKKIVHIATMRA